MILMLYHLTIDLLQDAHLVFAGKAQAKQMTLMIAQFL